MWVLACDGDILGGKRFLLRPGEDHLFGRTKQDQKNSHAIDNKSVSRKHLSIAVTPTSGQGHNPKARSTVTLRDDSKIGTLLNGEKFKQTTRTLSNDVNEYTLQLGTFEQKLRITWQPVVLTFALSSKWIKDCLDGLRTRLEAIDVRSITHFIHGTTTHVIADKRNTSKGLQALVSANYIVTEDYPEEIIKAGAVPLSDLQPAKAPLEVDFDGQWPDEINFLPPQGKEPVPRPPSFFAPDPERNDIFAKFTFVFGDKSQFDNLQSPINMGGGKALLFQVDLGETMPEQFAARVRELAGEDQEEEEGDALRKHVVVVHHRLINGHEDWIKQFTHDLERRLGQRSIEQNEFLDSILTKNVNHLHRPLEEDPDIPMSTAMSEPSSSRLPASGVEDSVEFDTTQPPSNNTRSRNRHDKSEVQVPSSDKSVENNPLPRRRFRRGQTTVSRFTGFGEFDPSSIQKVEYDEDDPSQASASMSRILEEDSQPSMVRDSNDVYQTRTTRKRRGPPSDHDSPNEEDIVNGLLPAAAAMKRRRIAEGHPPTSGQKEKSPSPQPTARMAAMKRKTKAEKEIDVREFARQRREAEEEAARKDAEALERALEGMDIDHIKNLVQVEEMEIPTRRSVPVQITSDRWDERWNGRKNFKRFRRKGTSTGPMRGQRVIVPFEEVKRKDFGISDDSFADELSRGRSKTGSKSNTQQSREQEALRENAAPVVDSEGEDEIISIHSDEDEDEEATPAPTRTSKRKSDPDSHSQKNTSRTTKKPKTGTGVPDSVNSSRTSRSSSRKITPTPQSIPETVISESQASRSTRGKRSAAASAREAPGKKKTRSFVPDSDGSDDDLAFAFGKRKG